MFEHLHGPLVKRIYRQSNKRNVDGQIMKFHARRIPDVVPVDDPAGRDTAMRQAHASLAIPDASFSRVSHFVRATPDYFDERIQQQDVFAS
ncbi:unnamed protein product, partial [Closterium sp. NIES-53]